jgi:hypothetical protein
MSMGATEQAKAADWESSNTRATYFPQAVLIKIVESFLE